MMTMASLFERLDRGRPPPAEAASKQPHRSPPKLLDWLLTHWNKPTVTARDIYRVGPNSIRNRKSAIDLAEILAKHGWLVPLKVRRRDMKEWQIVRGPGGEPKSPATISS
jgi:hypothetical protein